MVTGEKPQILNCNILFYSDLCPRDQSLGSRVNSSSFNKGLALDSSRECKSLGLASRTLYERLGLSWSRNKSLVWL